MTQDVPRAVLRGERPSVRELADFLKSYAKQETLEPLRGAGRWIAFGAAGALSLGLGLSIVLLGLLRLLQSEWSRSASGRLSWLSYAIVLAVCIAMLLLTIKRINKTFLHRESTR